MFAVFYVLRFHLFSTANVLEEQRLSRFKCKYFFNLSLLKKKEELLLWTLIKREDPDQKGELDLGPFFAILASKV